MFRILFFARPLVIANWSLVRTSPWQDLQSARGLGGWQILAALRYLVTQ